MNRDLRHAFNVPVYGTGPIKVSCLDPEHEDDTASFAVYPDHAYCYGLCSRYFGFKEVLEILGIEADELPEAPIIEKAEPYQPADDLIANLWSWHLTLMSPESPRHRRRRWLDRYGLWDETLERYQIGHTGTMFSIPIWRGKEILGVRFRLDPDYHSEKELKKSKYTQPRKQPGLLFRPNPEGEITIVTEGEFDALCLAQYGYDAVTATTGSGSLHKLVTRQELLKDKRFIKTPIYIATDDDKDKVKSAADKKKNVGERAYERICEAWGQRLPRVRFWVGKDISEELIQFHPAARSQHMRALLAEADEQLEREWECD